MRLCDTGLVKIKRGDIGIEIEVEGAEPLPEVNSDWWTSKKEDSLRNYGMEYVTTRPLKVGQEVQDAVEYICKIINKKNLIKPCDRTSIHTHHNMTRTSYLHILNSICLFWIMENVLARYCGEDRESNLFCLRLKDAEAILDETIESLDSARPLLYFGHENSRVKYSGLNIGTLGRFGSLEVRLHGGTTDPDEIVEWAANMQLLFVNAQKWKDPSAFFDDYLKIGSRKLVDGIFGEKFATKLRDQIPQYKSIMEENAVLVSELAYCKDWQEWEKGLPERFKDKHPFPKKTNMQYLSLEDMPGYTPTGLNFTPTYITTTVTGSATNG